MKDYQQFLEYFGIPENIIERVVNVRVKDHYFWAIEKKDNQVTVSCAVDKNYIYDGEDRTLTEKITTSTNLVYHDSALDHTLILQKYINPFNEKDYHFIVTSLKDLRCVVEK